MGAVCVCVSVEKSGKGRAKNKQTLTNAINRKRKPT